MSNLRDKENKEKKKTCQQLVYEIILDSPIKPTYEEQVQILKDYQLKFGLYKAFIKYHKENNGHQHLVIYLIDKPKINITKLNDYFTFNNYKPKCVNLSKLTKTKSALKKFVAIVNYITDGHDNGKYNDTANYKFDPEIEQCSDFEGKAITYYMRGMTTKEILKLCNNSEKYKLITKKAQLIKASKLILAEETEYEPEFNELLPVQNQILEEQKKIKNGREILIIIDKKGKSGKTELAKHIKGIYGEDNAVIFPNAKTKDISCAYYGQENIIFNFSKSVDTKKINTQIIEHLIDGNIFDSKYMSQSIEYKQKNKIIILANNHLNYNNFSNDRCKIFEITEEENQAERSLRLWRPPNNLNLENIQYQLDALN